MRKAALPLLATFALLATAPSRAEVYTVKLTSGGVFETRYEPKPATWDKSMLVFLDETGLQVALPKALVAEVTSLSENKGFGRVIDGTTVDLGFMPNDLPQQGPNAPTPQAQLEAALANRQSYDQQQFVEPGEAGGGIPVTTAGQSAPQGFAAPARDSMGNIPVGGVLTQSNPGPSGRTVLPPTTVAVPPQQ
jgi:hypothetical protein